MRSSFFFGIIPHKSCDHLSRAKIKQITIMNLISVILWVFAGYLYLIQIDLQFNPIKSIFCLGGLIMSILILCFSIYEILLP